MNDRILGLLGLMRRAGKLTAGFDAAKDRIKEKTAVLIVLAGDTSEKTEKSIRFTAAEHDVKLVRIPPIMEDIGRAIGRKKAGVLAVTDSGFAKKLLTLSGKEDEEECTDVIKIQGS